MQLEITNPDKIIFPDQKIKKLDIINYYLYIGEIMLPFVKNRLLSTNKCHKGTSDKCFFKKHPTNDLDMVHTFMDGAEEYFYLTNQAELIYQVQMGTLEFHTWGSNVKNIENPNTMIFDLDPDKKLPIRQLRQAVLKIKSVLDELQLKSFLKTSGGKGYHIVVPFKSSANWEEFYNFSKQIALFAENKWPKIFTTNLKKSERKGKIFIDYLRNNRGSTCVAPYSLRARNNAPVSMPIFWEDLNKIKPDQITLKNYKKYLNNAWSDFLRSSKN